MILHTDGHPVRRRYSVGFVGSLLFHVALVAVVLWQAGEMRSGDSAAGRGGYSSGRHRGIHSPALLRSGQFGGDPTGIAGAMSPPPSASWPVRQAERLRLRLAIGWAIDHVWQSTLFAIVIGLLTLAFRRNRARVRYALWLAASVKFLVPFSLVMWLGSAIGTAIAASSRAVFGASDPLSAGVAGAPETAGSLRALGDVSWALLQDVARIPLIGGIGQWLAATGTAALWPSTFTISEVAAAWLALAVLGIWTVVFFAIVARRVKLSRQLWDVALTSRRVELLDVKVPARLQVGLADGLLAPGVIGWLHPVLLLPADIERHLTRPELEAVIAHELCHVRRFDNMTAAIHMLVEAIFWFHPLVWWLGARLVDERERACDEHVLSTVGAPGQYAQGILNVCKRYTESPLASVSGVGSANVRQRIDAILANRIGEATGPWKKVMLSGVISSVSIVPLAAGALMPTPPRATAVDAATSVPAAAAPAYATAYTLVVADADGRLGPELRRSSLARIGANGDANGADTRDAADTGDAVMKTGLTRAAHEAGTVIALPASNIVFPREIAADAMTLPRLAAVLASVLGSDVEDRTGLDGDFMIRLTWTSNPRGPSLFDAVEHQLGLRLVPMPSQTRSGIQ